MAKRTLAALQRVALHLAEGFAAVESRLDRLIALAEGERIAEVELSGTRPDGVAVVRCWTAKMHGRRTAVVRPMATMTLTDATLAARCLRGASVVRVTVGTDILFAAEGDGAVRRCAILLGRLDPPGAVEVVFAEVRP